MSFLYLSSCSPQWVSMGKHVKNVFAYALLFSHYIRTDSSFLFKIGAVPAVLKRVQRLGVKIVQFIPSFEFYSGYGSVRVSVRSVHKGCPF